MWELNKIDSRRGGNECNTLNVQFAKLYSTKKPVWSIRSPWTIRGLVPTASQVGSSQKYSVVLERDKFNASVEWIGSDVKW